MGEVSSLCDNGIPMESYSMKELISRPGAKYTEVICPASAMVYRPSLFKKTFYNKKYLLSVVLTTFIFFGLGTAVYAETAPTVQGGVIDLRNWNFDTRGKVLLSGNYGFSLRIYGGTIFLGR